MGTPVTWNPFGGNGYAGGPITSNPTASSPTSSNSTGAAQPSSGTYFQSYGNPFTPTATAWQPLLSDDLAAEGRSLAAKAGGIEQSDDAYAQLIALSRLTQQVDGQLQTLLQQPIDLAAAQGQLTTAQANQTQFLKQVYGALAPDQLQQLHALSVTVEQAQGPQQQAAVSNFNQALDAVLTLEQRQSLLGLQRAVEDAQLNLQGQQILKRILDARGGVAAPAPYQAPNAQAAQTLSLAMADARALLALRMQIQADRKVQDVYALIMTAQMRQTLAPLQQELLASTAVLQHNPNAPWAQTRFDKAKADFDRVFGSLVNTQDREVLKNFEGYQRVMQNLAATLGGEASAEHTYYDLTDHPASIGPNLPSAADQKSQLDLARAEFNLAQHNRTMRTLAARASAQCNSDLHQQATAALMQSLRMTADLDILHAQANYDQTVQGVAATHNPQSVTAARQLLDAANRSRQELEQALTPLPLPPKKSGWDYALDIAMGVGEIVGGVALGVMTSWTGAGLVASIAIIADGSVRLGHSISDAANGTVTDAPISAGLQKLGMSQNWANRTDAGINLAATAPVAVSGAAITAVRATGMIVKGINIIGGALVIDGGQAQVRYIASGEAVAPFSVLGLTSAGLTPTQANYVLLGGNLVATGGMATAASGRALTGRSQLAFKEFTAADASQAARVADWYSRGAPSSVRKNLAAELLGPNASRRAISREASTLRGQALVVVREGSSDTATSGIAAAAVLKRDSKGSFGRDPLGGKVASHTTQIVRVAGDDLGRQQAIAASVVGTEAFTRQQAISWYATTAEDSRKAPGAVVANRRVRRDAVQKFEQIPAAQRPDAVNAALNSSLSNEAQLRALAEISTNDRYSWPAGTQDLLYQRTFKRPPLALGSVLLGKIVHPMHRDSFMSQANRWANPTRRAIDWWEKSHPRSELLQTFPGENGGPARVAVLNKPHSLSEPVLYEIASAHVEGQPTLAQLPASVNKTMESLRGRNVVTVWDQDGNLVAGGAVSRNLNEPGDSNATSPPSSATRDPAGTAYLVHGFSVRLDGWPELLTAADTFAGQRGARFLIADPDVPQFLLPVDYELPRMQRLGWSAFNRASYGYAWVRAAGATARNAVTGVVAPVLKPITGAGRWVMSGVNPYSYPKGIAPGAVRSWVQNQGYAIQYLASEFMQTGAGAVRVSLIPQILTGNAHLVTNDDRAVRPFNGLPGSESVAVYFAWTGTMITLWGNGPNLRGPAPLDPNGLQPLLRVRPALHDPNGPNSAGLLGTVRLILGGEVNLGMRYFGSNDGLSAQSTLSFRLARINSNVRGDLPIQSGGPKGLSLIGSITAFAPSTSHAIYFGRQGVTFRSMRVTMAGTSQTSALASAAQATGYRAGSYYTLGARDVSGGSGVYLTLNPAYGYPDFRP